VCAGSLARTSGRRPGSRSITPPTVTQSRASPGAIATPTGGVGGLVDVEGPVVVPGAVPTVVDAAVVAVVVESVGPTEASDVRAMSSEPSAPSSPTSARTPVRTSMAAIIARLDRAAVASAHLYASPVPPLRTGTHRAMGLLVSCVLATLLVSAGSVRANSLRRPVGSRILNPSALAAAQERAVERLAALGLPVFCGGGRLPNVALTFDDGPSPYTASLLRLLRHSDAGATFFLVGNRLVDWPGAAASEARLGSVGDHTWSHPRLPGLRYDAAAWEIVAGRRAVEAASGHVVFLFRPPYGLATPRLDRLVGRLGMLDVRWTVDAGDSLPGATARSVVRSVEGTVAPGSIVLLHDIHPWTLVAVRRLLPWFERHGLRLVSVPELLRLDAPTIRRRHGNVSGRHCGTRPTALAR
jgi:peptidoglycan/xylan/chitin deacetylase (PgdA/CDA1 family)